MEMTARAFVTLIHGLLFGGFFIMALFGLLVGLVGCEFTAQTPELTKTGYALERVYLSLTAAVGWTAVFLGAYVIYPWYRAAPPAGTVDLAGYPQRLLLAHVSTAGWHEFGMEWKEHVAWLAPMAATMLAYVLVKHRPVLKAFPSIRRTILLFALAAFGCAGIAGFFGAMINKFAPLQGGPAIRLMRDR